MSNTSLVKLLTPDTDYATRFTAKVKTIKADRTTLLQSAADFNKEYEAEIRDGTEKRKFLLENGKSKGLSEAEIFKNNTAFLPTVQTPILNFLYFLMRKYPDATVNYEDILKEEINTERNRTINPAYIKAQYKTLNENDTSNDNISNENLKYGHLMADDLSNNVHAPEMSNHIFDHISLGDFNKIKKLKALSKSSNKEEAFSAYSKAIEMCKRYEVNFDRIPCNVN